MLYVDGEFPKKPWTVVKQRFRLGGKAERKKSGGFGGIMEEKIARIFFDISYQRHPYMQHQIEAIKYWFSVIEY